MPRLQAESIGAGDQSWLGSAHGIWNCRTETLDVEQFTAADHYPDGYIPSGTPVAKVAGLLVPYNSDEAATDLAGVLAGFLFTDQPVGGDATMAVPVLDHGRVKANRIPAGAGEFTAPVAAAKAGNTTIVFI